MKHFVLILENMADEPIESLGGRTPLEIAKTPNLDSLSRGAEMAMAAWAPAETGLREEVAAFSLLGYDPRESFTGLAPLECAARGIAQSDASVVFRCDLVTVTEVEMVDPTAGNIPANEAEALLKRLRVGLLEKGMRLENMGGYRNLLFVEDAARADELDDLECGSPEELKGERLAKGYPNGKAAAWARGFIEKSAEILKDDEINRVRIDLGENPASMLWLWGQGRRPKLKSFRDRTGKSGAYWMDRDAWAGLAELSGLRSMKSLAPAEFRDVNFIRWTAAADSRKDFKAKVRRIEEFDAKVVGEIMKYLSKGDAVAVTTDLWISSSKGEPSAASVPLLIAKAGEAAAGETPRFCEKSCSQSGKVFERGHKFLEQFLS